MKRTGLGIISLLGAFALAACSTGGAANNDSTHSTSAPHANTSDDPNTGADAQRPASDPRSLGPDTAAQAQEHGPVDAPGTPTAANGIESMHTLDSGRPRWFFPEIQRSGEWDRACAEALGPTAEAAHTAAIERARERLASASHAHDAGIRILDATHSPLPHQGTAQHRYVAYVMIQVDAEGDSSAITSPRPPRASAASSPRSTQGTRADHRADTGSRR